MSNLLIDDLQANSEAACGTYAGGIKGAAGDAGLFVANHAY